ncbi:hypothetical protein DFS34DRAFT_361802 [Phlyctochytrium arcticum]|nr:hypothetical protein DFS34DRAFT_361802 [Phlyctochytrium arcticum]
MEVDHAGPSDVVPGEGARMRKLREVFEAALSACLKGCSYEKMAQAFPRLARDDPKALHSARDQLINFIRTSIQEFQDISADRDLVANLNQLDRIVAAAQQKIIEKPDSAIRKGAKRGAANLKVDEATAGCLHFRPTPGQAVRAHRVDAKRKEVLRLKALLSGMQSEQVDITQKLDEARQQLFGAQFEVESSLRQLVPPPEITRRIESECMADLAGMKIS